MKKYTCDDIADYIINSDMNVCEGCYYYVTVDRSTGELVYTQTDDTETFTIEIDDSEWAGDETPERFYNEFETKDNDDFMFICTMFANDINRFISKDDPLEKLYNYLGMDINNSEDDIMNCYLTENRGRDGEMYFYYMDETKIGAVNESTGEIITDSDQLDDLFS